MKPSKTSNPSLDNHLISAAWDGNIDSVMKALKQGANIEAVGGHLNGTALHGAARNGHLKVVQYLIQNRANVNTQSSAPWFHTPLHQAAFFNQLEIARVLLEHGADPKARVSQQSGHAAGKLPHEAVGSASGSPNQQLVVLLSQAYNKQANVPAKGHYEQPQKPAKSQGNTQLNTQLINAAWEGNFRETQIALQSGADLDAIGGHHNGTALNAAARNGHLDVVSLLLTNGANVHTPAGAPWYHTPLHNAAFYNRIAVVQCLLQFGADPNSRISENSNFGTGQLPYQVVGMVEGPPNPQLVSLLKDYGSQRLPVKMVQPPNPVGIQTGSDSAEIKGVFDAFDKTRAGFITMRDMVNMCRRQNQRYSESQLKSVFDEIDFNKNRRIHYEEFQNWWVNGRKGEGGAMANMCMLILKSND